MPASKEPRPISPLFSSYLTVDEKNTLRAIPIMDCSSEIALMRVLNARLLGLQMSVEMDIDMHMQILRTRIILSEQHAKLIRASNQDHKPLVEIQQMILEALDEVSAEMGL